MVEKTDWLSDDAQKETEEVLQITTTASTVDDNASSSADSQLEATEHNEGGNCDNDGTYNNNDDDSDKNKDNNTETKFEVGDHIYSWCSFLGIPHVYTHHGIVIDRDDSIGTVTILDFSYLISDKDSDSDSDGNSKGGNTIPKFPARLRKFSTTTSTTSSALVSSLPSSTISDDSILRSYTIDHSHASNVWNKVKYGASFPEVLLMHRAGTASRGNFDPVDTVLARAQFLIGTMHLLSNYDTMLSNCEHVAVWCKTGRFSSLQLLSGMGHSLALSTVPTVAVSAATTTVPASGLWGWLGYTTSVSLASTMPWLIPVAIVPTVFAAGKSAFDVQRWKQTTGSLNTTFEEWRQADDPPPLWRNHQCDKFADEGQRIFQL